jgi:hypothetical protein
LSQDRAYAAADFIFMNLRERHEIRAQVKDFKWQNFAAWRDHVLTATGRGSAEPILLKDTLREDFEKSKRIEFKFTIKHNYEGYRSILGENK